MTLCCTNLNTDYKPLSIGHSIIVIDFQHQTPIDKESTNPFHLFIFQPIALGCTTQMNIQLKKNSRIEEKNTIFNRSRFDQFFLASPSRGQNLQRYISFNCFNLICGFVRMSWTQRTRPTHFIYNVSISYNITNDKRAPAIIAFQVFSLANSHKVCMKICIRMCRFPQPKSFATFATFAICWFLCVALTIHRLRTPVFSVFFFFAIVFFSLSFRLLVRRVRAGDQYDLIFVNMKPRTIQYSICCSRFRCMEEGRGREGKEGKKAGWGQERRRRREGLKERWGEGEGEKRRRKGGGKERKEVTDGV